MLQLPAYHLICLKQVGRRDTLSVRRICHDERQSVTSEVLLHILLSIGQSGHIGKVLLLNRDIFCKTCTFDVFSGYINSLEINVITINVVSKFRFLGIIIVYLVKEVSVEVFPLLKGILFSEYSGGHVSRYQGSLYQQRS